mgnify:CR=1 FL=1
MAVTSTPVFAQTMNVGALNAIVSTAINVELLVISNLLKPSIVFDVYQKWLIGDFFGFAFVTPVLLILFQPWPDTWTRQKFRNFVIYLFIAFIFGQAVFFGWFRDLVDLTGRGFLAIFIVAFFG